MTATTGVQEYLEAMFRLSNGTTHTPVSTSGLANAMSISPASVSEMLRRLSAQGLINHEPYAGATLTPAGLAQAAQVVRYHRLWERFLTDVLGMPWDQVHAEACRLEHATSAAVADSLDAFLQHPATCPHGNELPAAAPAGDLDPEADPDRAAGTPTCQMALLEVPQGFRGIVKRVDEHPDLLQYCAALGLIPGAAVHVVGRDAFEQVRQIEIWLPSVSIAVGPEPPTVTPSTTATIGPRAAAGVFLVATVTAEDRLAHRIEHTDGSERGRDGA